MLRLGRAAPTVGVRDMARALGFYESVLGLSRTFENGDPLSFVVLKRDAAELHLQLVPAEWKPPVEQNVMHLIVESGIEELYARCQAALDAPAS